MAFVPGTSIDQPTVELSDAVGLRKVTLAKKALHRAAVPEEVITTFLQATAADFGDAGAVDTTIAQYVVVA
jgi:hypothetical protein